MASSLIDSTPFSAEEFAPPHGGFLVGYLDGRPVAMGGWRFAPYAAPAGADRAAEIKRMYVADAARGRGFGRTLLSALEDDARAAGADWMVLETGQPQIAAVGSKRQRLVTSPRTASTQSPKGPPRQALTT